MELQPFVIEIIAEFGFAIFIVILRIYARTKIVGLRGWKGDDYLVLVALICYILEISFLPLTVMIQEAGDLGSVEEGKYANITDKQQAALKQVALWDIGGWIMYTTVIWSCKGCMLFIYNRLSFGLWEDKGILVAAWATVLTYIAVIITVTCHCLPMSKFWEKTDNPDHCTLDLENFYVVGITNFITDALILAVPIPLLWVIRLPLRRKLVIGVFLCGGIFAMVCTVMRTVTSVIIMTRREYNSQYGTVLGWACRENFVAILVVNAPCIKPLFANCTCFGLRSVQSSNATGSSGYTGMSGGSTIRRVKRNSRWQDTASETWLSGVDRNGDIEFTDMPPRTPRETDVELGADGLLAPPSPSRREAIVAVGPLDGPPASPTSPRDVAFESGNRLLGPPSTQPPPPPRTMRGMSLSERQRKMSVGFEDLVEGIVEDSQRPNGRRPSLYNIRRPSRADAFGGGRRRPTVIEVTEADNQTATSPIIEESEAGAGLFTPGYKIS